MNVINKNNYFILIIVGVLLLAFRNTTPLIVPTIYAEDGLWIAKALSHGWMNTFVHAREDYFVFFNIFFLFLSTMLSEIFSGSPLLLLAESIAIVSYFFYALISVMIYHCILKISKPSFAILAFLITLFLPLGQSQHETIGRLVQVGFYMPVMSLCLILFREDIEKKALKCLIDLIILLTAATNPVVFPIVGIYYFIKFIATSDKLKLFKDLLPLAIAMAALALFILPRLDGSGGISDYSYNPNNIIEMSTARLLLYPFLFPWYRELNNVISISLSLVYVVFCVFVIYKTQNRKVKVVLLAILLALAITVVATIFGRIGLTSLLNNYQTTFPDRYFSGANVLSVFLFVGCLSQCSFSMPGKVVSLLLCGFLVYLYSFHMSGIIQNSSLKKNVVFNDYFVYDICNATPVNSSTSSIQIKPSGWFMTVPKDLVSQIRCR